LKNAGDEKYVGPYGPLRMPRDGFLVLVVAFSLKGFMPGAMWICVSFVLSHFSSIRPQVLLGSWQPGCAVDNLHLNLRGCEEASPKGQKGGKDHEESTLQDPRRLVKIFEGFAGMIDEGIIFGSMLIRKFYPFLGSASKIVTLFFGSILKGGRW
jgi:hypothetical protein